MKCTQLLCLLFLIASSCNNNEEKPAPAVSPKMAPEIVRKEMSNPYAPIDISPMDVSYFPDDYPVQKMTGTDKLPVARVIYSRPHRQGRKIFGSLLNYGEPWRLGANESTEIEFFQPVTIHDKKVPAGRYVLYSIPDSSNWTIVFNENIYSWGLKHDPAKDVFKFKAPTEPTNNSIEYFTMVFEKTASGADLIMTWDEVLVRLPISFTY